MAYLITISVAIFLKLERSSATLGVCSGAADVRRCRDGPLSLAAQAGASAGAVHTARALQSAEAHGLKQSCKIVKGVSCVFNWSESNNVLLSVLIFVNS